MPLTLDCYCPGDATVSVCELVELRFIATLYSEAQFASLEFHPLASGSSGPGISTGGGGSVSLDQVISGPSLAGWVANWATLNVKLFAQSTFVTDNTITRGTWKIIQHYLCVDEDGHIDHIYRSAFPTGDDGTWCDDGGIKIIGSAAGSGGSIYMIHTSPLGCTDLALMVGDFQPEIEPPLIGTGGGTPNHCLCASGGSGDYLYSSVGELPEGMSLDFETGCLVGSPTGTTPGARTITFRVTDRANGDTADVTCAYVPGCGCQDIGNSFY
jgi:hypothetical protein